MWLRHNETKNMPPEWAPAGSTVTQLNAGGCIGQTHDGIGGAPADGWCDAGDGWQARLQDGERPISRELRTDEDATRVHASDGTWCIAVPATDILGEQWTVPLVMRPDGHCLLSQKLKKTSAGWIREPTQLQTRLINSASYFLSAIDDAEASLEVDADCAAELLAAACHASPELIASSGLLDEQLIMHAFTACVGVQTDG